MIIIIKNKITYIYRLVLPKELRFSIKKIIKFFYYRFRFVNLKLFLILSKRNVNLILGAALTKQKGWFSTNEEWLDISKEKDWERLFYYFARKNNPSIKF